MKRFILYSLFFIVIACKKKEEPAPILPPTVHISKPSSSNFTAPVDSNIVFEFTLGAESKLDKLVGISTVNDSLPREFLNKGLSGTTTTDTYIDTRTPQNMVDSKAVLKSGDVVKLSYYIYDKNGIATETGITIVIR